MTKFQGPRADSRAYKVLIALTMVHSDANRNLGALHRSCGGKLTFSEFKCTVLSRLETMGFVTIDAPAVSITQAGRDYVYPPIVAPEPERAPVGSRYVAPRQDLKKRVRLLPIRAGAFEYRDIPSRHGDQRVAFKPGFPGLGETQE